MKTDEELKQLAQDILLNKVYTDRHIPAGAGDRALLTVFLPLMLMEEAALKDLIEVQKPDLIYEYLDQAGPRTVNAMPSFMSFRFLNKEDSARMFGFYEKIKAAVASVK